MKNIDKEYKEYYNNINLANEMDELIFKKTIYKNSNNLILKKVLIVIISVISIGFIGTFIVNANKIKSFFKIEKVSSNNITLSKYHVKNLKEINYNAELEETEYNSWNEKKITYKELEEKLNIKFLNSNKLINNEVTIYSIEKVDGLIASGKFFIRDAFLVKKENNKNSYITIDFQFNTKYSKIHKNGYNLFSFAHSNLIKQNEFITSKYIKNIDTDVYFVGSKSNLGEFENSISLIAFFVYDDIGYSLNGLNISIDDMTKILETLK